jgi:hypothetical protein
MLKEGNKRALILFGFGEPSQIDVEGLVFDRQSLAIGDELLFSFQIKEADFEAGSYTISKKHSFKDLTTQKHYPGLHQFTTIINGIEKATGIAEVVKIKRAG